MRGRAAINGIFGNQRSIQILPHRLAASLNSDREVERGKEGGREG